MYYFSKSFLSFYNDEVTTHAKMPKDVVEINQATYDAMMLSIQNGLVIKVGSNGQPLATRSPVHIPAEETTEQQLSRYSLVLTNKIHDLAKEWEYDNSHDAVTYHNSSIPLFAAESKALIEYRDKAWHRAHVLITRIKAGTSKMPLTEQDFLDIVLPPKPTRPTV